MTFISRLLSYIFGPSKAIIVIATSVKKLRAFIYDHLKQRIPVFSNNDYYIFDVEDRTIFLKRVDFLSAGAFRRIVEVVEEHAGSLPAHCFLLHSRLAPAFFSRRALSKVMKKCESTVVMSDNGILSMWEPLPFEDVLKISK